MAILIMRGLPALSSFEQIPSAPPRPDSGCMWIEALGGCGREATGGSGLGGDRATPWEPLAALLLVAQYKWVLSGSHRKWMTSLSMRGPSCWSTTPAAGTPVCGQTWSCTHECTQNPWAPCSSPQWHTPQEEISGVCLWPQTPGWGAEAGDQGGSDGGLYPSKPGRYYMPISAALSSLGSQEVNQLKSENSLWPSPL